MPQVLAAQVRCILDVGDFDHDILTRLNNEEWNSLLNKIVIIGQGYVGLPLAQGAALAGLSVVGLDLNSNVVDQLNSGKSHIDDLSDQDIKSMISNGYTATTDTECIADADVVVVCVPTPLGEAGSPDLRFVEASMKSIRDNATGQTLIILESTTYPGTTENYCLPILTEDGALMDHDIFLAFSPERIDPGNKVYGLKNTPKIVGGVTAESLKRSVAFYAQFVDTVVPVKGAREAETAKLLENTYRHINIALVNEMVKFCHELEIDLWDVIDAAATKPFGFQAFYPGPGVGGHCIPIDPNYLSYQVRASLGYPFRFVELAEEINNSMPQYVVDRVQDLLNGEFKALRGSKILILGVTYKPNIADQRESPAVPFAKILLSKGGLVDFHDPKVISWNVGEQKMQRVADLKQSVESADIVVCLQNHDEYDLDELANNAKIFFDTRGKVTAPDSHRL